MTYRVELIHSKEGYSVACPDLPGCASHGETEEEAINNIREAIGEYLVAKKNGSAQRDVRFVEVPDAPEMSQPNRKPFKVKSSKLGLPTEWTSGKIEDLLDILEGPDRRW